MESDTSRVMAALDKLGVDYKTESGNKIKLCCPFHAEKTPSMFVFDNNDCYCFGCQRFCWHDELIAKIADCSIIEAKKKLGTFDPDANYIVAPIVKGKFKIPRIEFADPVKDFSESLARLSTDVPKEMQEFMESKSLEGYACDLGKWRWLPKGTFKCWENREGVCIPYFGPDGEIATFRLREYDRMRGRFGHSLAPKGIPLQASYMVFNKNKPVYFCEGETDSLSMRAIGRNVICLPGVGAHKQLHTALTVCFEWGIPKLIFCGDNDEAGNAFNQYAVQTALTLGVGRYTPQLRILKLPTEYNLLPEGGYKRKDINDFFKEGRLNEIMTQYEKNEEMTPQRDREKRWEQILTNLTAIMCCEPGETIEELPASVVEGIF